MLNSMKGINKMKKIILTIMMLLSFSSFCFAQNPSYIYLGEFRNVETYVNVDDYRVDNNTTTCFMLTKDNVNCIIANTSIVINTETHVYSLIHTEGITFSGNKFSQDLDIDYKPYKEGSPINKADKIIRSRNRSQSV